MSRVVAPSSRRPGLNPLLSTCTYRLKLRPGGESAKDLRPFVRLRLLFRRRRPLLFLPPKCAPPRKFSWQPRRGGPMGRPFQATPIENSTEAKSLPSHNKNQRSTLWRSANLRIPGSARGDEKLRLMRPRRELGVPASPNACRPPGAKIKTLKKEWPGRRLISRRDRGSAEEDGWGKNGVSSYRRRARSLMAPPAIGDYFRPDIRARDPSPRSRSKFFGISHSRNPRRGPGGSQRRVAA